MKNLVNQAYTILPNGSKSYRFEKSTFEQALATYLEAKVGMPVLHHLECDPETKSLLLCIDNHYEGDTEDNLQSFIPYLEEGATYEDDWELGEALMEKIQNHFEVNTCEFYEVLREIIWDVFGTYGIPYQLENGDVEVVLLD